jgi:hypothetical protein
VKARCLRAWIAKLHAARASRRERRPGASRDCLAFLLGNQRHVANGHPIGVRHVDRDEVDAWVPKAQNEHRVTAQTIEPADDQLSAIAAAGFERLDQPQSIGMALAALDLDHLVDQFPVAAIENVSTAARCALRPRPD